MNEELREDCAQLLAGIQVTTNTLAAFVAEHTMGELPVCYFEVMDYLERISEFLEGPLSLPLDLEASS